MKTIFVIYGAKGSGKDTCFEILRDNIGGHFVAKVSFADKLRDTVWELFKGKIVDRERIYGTIEKKEEEIIGWEIPKSLNYKEQYWSGRRLLQWFGTDVCRTVYNTVWIEALGEQLKNVPQPYICVTDCRFYNEYQFLIHNTPDDYKVFFINVVRELGSNEYSGHASEQDWKNFEFDYKILNDKGLKELEYNFMNVFAALSGNINKGK